MSDQCFKTLNAETRKLYDAAASPLSQIADYPDYENMHLNNTTPFDLYEENILFKSMFDQYYETPVLPLERLYSYQEVSDHLYYEHNYDTEIFSINPWNLPSRLVNEFLDIIEDYYRFGFYNYNMTNKRMQRYLKTLDCITLMSSVNYLLKLGIGPYQYDFRSYVPHKLAVESYTHLPIFSKKYYELLQERSSYIVPADDVHNTRIVFGEKQSGFDEDYSIAGDKPVFKRERIKNFTPTAHFDNIRKHLITIQKAPEKSDYVSMIREQRKKKREAKKLEVESRVLPKNVPDMKNNAVSKEAKEAFARHMKKAHDRKGYLMRRCAPNTPFYLDPKNGFFKSKEGFQPMDDLERLRLYNKTHSCSCNRRCNMIRYSEEDHRFFAECDHSLRNRKGQPREILRPVLPNFKCKNCGAQKVCTVSRRNCTCDVIYHCHECLKTIYCKDEEEKIVCVCGLPDDFEMLNAEGVFVQTKKIDAKVVSYADAAKVKTKDLPVGEKILKLKGKKKFFEELKPGSREEIFGDKQSLSSIAEGIATGVKSAYVAGKNFVTSTIKKVFNYVLDGVTDLFVKRLVSRWKEMALVLLETSTFYIVIINQLIALHNTENFYFGISCLVGIIMSCMHMKLFFNLGKTIDDLKKNFGSNTNNDKNNNNDSNINNNNNNSNNDKKGKRKDLEDLDKQTEQLNRQIAEEQLIHIYLQFGSKHKRVSISENFHALIKKNNKIFSTSMINAFHDILPNLDPNYPDYLHLVSKYLSTTSLVYLLEHREMISSVYESCLEAIVDSSDNLQEFIRETGQFQEALQRVTQIQVPEKEASSLLDLFANKDNSSDEDDNTPFGDKQSFSFGDILQMTSTLFSLPLTLTRKFYMMSLLRNFNTLFTTARNINTMFKEWISFLPKFLTCYFKPDLGKEWLLQELKDENSLPSRLAQSAISVKLAIDIVADKEEVNALRAEAKDLLAEFEHMLVESGVVIDNNITRWLKIMSEMIHTVNMGVQREREPFCVRIIGPPGCAKSTYWSSIVSPLFKGHSPEQIVKEMTYVRNPGIEFWDGLSVDNHRIVVYDDFAQQTEETEFPEIISLVSRAAFIPAMASVDYSKPELGYKGQQYSPDLVVLLSNVDCISGSKTINFSEAIERRPHINIVFPKYAKPTMDFNTMVFEYFLSAGSKTERRMHTVTGIKEIQKAILESYKKYISVNAVIKTTVEGYCYKDDDAIDITQSETRSQVQQKILEKMFGVKQGAGSMAKRILDAILHFNSSANSVLKFLKDETVSTIRKFFDSIRKPELPWYKNIAKLLALGSSIAIVVLGIYLYNRDVFSGIFGEDQSGTTVTKHPNTMHVVSGTRQNYTPECLYNNQCTIHFNGRKVQGIFVQSRVLLTVRHIFCDDSGEGFTPSKDVMFKLQHNKIKFFPDESEFILEMANGQCVVQKFWKKRVIELYKDGDDMSDVVLYECDSQVSAKRNILNHFIPHDMPLKDRSINMNGIDKEKHRLIRTTKVEGDDFIMSYNVGRSAWAIAKSFKYILPTMKGDCGAYISTNEVQPKIVGIHIAGFKKDLITYGVSTRVSRELIEKGLKSLIDGIESEDFSVCLGESQMFVTPLEGNNQYGPSIAPLGVLEGCKAYPVGKTEIVKSPLFDKIVEHTTIPAIINIYDKRIGDRDIILEGVNKYGKVKKLHDPDITGRVFSSMYDEIRKPTVEPRILTTLEAINGVGDIKGLDMSTSAGFPFSCLGRGGDKRKLFVWKDEMWYPTEELEHLININEEKFRNGIVPFLPWVDCLKDERRPIAKVLEGKTRLFSSASVIYTIIFKKYYGSYIQHRVNLKIQTHSRIGINKDSIEWDEHVRKLAEVGMDNAIDLDYSAMDGNNAIDNVDLFFSLANHWYFQNTSGEDRDNALLRKTIQEFETHGRHIAYNKELKQWVVYELIGGTNSGSLITALLNTDSNEANMRRAWIYVAPREFKSLYYYKLFVRTAAFGDDIVLSMHYSIKDWFNADTIIKALEPYGVVLTTGRKDKDFNFQNLWDCTFLKNTTGKMMNRFVPLMEEKAMLEPLNWIRKSEFMVSEEKACEDNCNAVLRNCFWYGKSVFEHYRQRILDEKPYYNLLDFDSLFDDYYEFNILEDPLSLGGKKTKSL